MLHAYATGSIFGEPRGAPPFSLLALHGWARDHHDFDQLFHSGLPSGISALGIDLPGFGATPAPESVWGSEDYARALMDLFGDLCERPIIVGHSFGGRIALKLAVLYPQRVGGLVLTGVPLVSAASSKSPLAYRMTRSLARHGIVSDQRLDRARQRYGSQDYKNATGVMREILVRAVNERYEDDIAQVETHVEMLWGELDTTTPLAAAKRAQPLFADARLEVIEGQGHLVPTDAPDALSDAIGRILL